VRSFAQPADQTAAEQRQGRGREDDRLPVPARAETADSGRLAWAGTILAAAAHGAAFCLFPIGCIVLAAIFLYTLTVETGQFEIVKHSVTALSDDRRIQARLIAFC
jgi:hypothetical protein